MKRWLSALVFTLALFPVLTNAATTPAKQMPITANKVEGPVAGHLTDVIKLHVENNANAVSTVASNEPVTASFCTDKTIIESTYNTFTQRFFKAPHTTCVTPDRKLHLTGRRQNFGVHIVPEVEGQWRWESDYSLSFQPKHPWPAGQAFEVTFDANIFPDNVKLQNGNFHFETAPLAPHITQMEFFQDPNDVEKRGVSTTIEFNTPIEVQALRDHLAFSLQELTEAEKIEDRKVASKIDNLPFDVTLDEAGTEATIRTPINALADKERFLEVVIKPGLMAKSGGQALGNENPGYLEQRTRVPSYYDYASIQKLQLQIVKNEHFVPEQILIVHSNVPVTSEELAKHLQIFHLPEDKAPAFKDDKPLKNYAWTSANEATDDLLTKETAISYQPLPTADASSTMHSFKLDTVPGRWLYVRVSKGLPAKGGFILADDHNDTVLVPAYSKEVKILSDGALLSLSGEKKISVYSLDAQKLRFALKRVMNEDISHLVSQTGGHFANPSFENYNFGPQNISESFSEELKLPSDDMRKPQFSSFDFTSYLSKSSAKKQLFGKEARGRGLFFLTVDALNTDDKGKEVVVSTAHRFVLVSDLGLMVKTGSDNTHDVFVQSVKTGVAVPGAKVEVLGINGVPTVTVVTDTDGHAVIPNLAGFTDDKQPTVYVVRRGDDLAFMPYDGRDRELNYSQFDVGGNRPSAEGLRAYLFSDRGIYRPGEDIHIGMVVKQGDWSKNLADVPLQMDIVNSRGQSIDKPVIKLDASGIAQYSFSTHDTSPTGIYNVRLYVTAEGARGSQLGNTSVRVEEFQPDTLKIASTFNKPTPKGWISPDGLMANVTLEHLYGAPAVDHRVTASVNVVPGNFSFKDYPDYAFFDALKTEKSYDQPIGEAQTDKDGKASFDLNLSQFGNSTYSLTFFADGFAQDSGRSVHASNSVLVSPLPYVIGFKADANTGYINKGEKRELQLIAVNPDLKQIDVKDMKVQVSEVTYISSLIEDERGGYAYRSIPKETPLSSGTLTIPAAGTHYAFDTSKPGSYVLILSDGKGLVMHRIPYTVVGAGNIVGHARKDAVITVRLDQPKYEAGGRITMNIIAPYTGTGLITLETDKVLAFKWFKAATTSSVQTIDIPKGFTGKGFVNVQFVRALDSREVFTKPLAYDVEPFFVSTDSIDSQIKLDVPEKIKPGEILSIRYKVRKPQKIIIYAVDEGILQYAHYQTPNPLGYFVNSRALQVGTAQILDLLMPEFSILQELSAPGGGEVNGAGRTLNPFKRKTQPPVAFWSGIIDADTTEREAHFTVPDYFNGNLRVMAVAVSDETIGAAESRVFVKGDIIVSPNVPLFAAPGDEFTVGVSVANNILGSGKNAKLKLAVTPSEQLEVTDGAQSEVTVAEGGEAKITVRVKVKDVPGGASLSFVASSGSISARNEETLSVRPPLPSMTVLQSGYAEKGEKDVKQDRSMYKEFVIAEASVSTLPISLIPGLKEYLVRFPYGCTEQTVSKAFPAVILYEGDEKVLRDSGVYTMSEMGVRDSVVHTMSRLVELQNHEGGFGYWWYGGTADDFVSVYALHYMLLAKEKHLPVPDETFRRAQAYITNMVNHSPSSLMQARAQAYGIYVLTRSGVVTANYLPNLLQYLENNQKDIWRQDLTAVYIAATYKLMKLDPEANKLINDFTLGEPKYWETHNHYWSDGDFYNSLNRYAQYLTIISDHFPEMLPKLDRNILFRIANFIGEGDYNTLSSSYAIMAFNAYGAASMAQTQAQLAISQQDASGAWKPLALGGEQVKRAQLALAQGAVKFSGGGSYGLFYQMVTDGFDRGLPGLPIEDGLEIDRHYLDTDHQPVKEVAIGDTVDVVVTMRAHDNKTLENMALVDLLPAGFEVVPESVRRPAASDNANSDNNSDPQTAENDDAYILDGQKWTPDAVDMREDRVIAFGTVPSEEVVYHYRIKAVNAGHFVTPPAYVESMYDRSVKARGVAGTITVKSP